MAKQMIFKKQQFRCGGCGKAVTGKITTTPERARQPLSPPAGWYSADLDTQEKDTGAIAVLRIFCCTEACVAKALEGVGPGGDLLRKFQGVVGRTDLSDEAVAAAPVITRDTKATDAPDLARVEVEEPSNVVTLASR